MALIFAGQIETVHHSPGKQSDLAHQLVELSGPALTDGLAQDHTAGLHRFGGGHRRSRCSRAPEHPQPLPSPHPSIMTAQLRFGQGPSLQLLRPRPTSARHKRTVPPSLAPAPWSQLWSQFIPVWYRSPAPHRSWPACPLTCAFRAVPHTRQAAVAPGPLPARKTPAAAAARPPVEDRCSRSNARAHVVPTVPRYSVGSPRPSMSGRRCWNDARYPARLSPAPCMYAAACSSASARPPSSAASSAAAWMSVSLVRVTKKSAATPVARTGTSRSWSACQFRFWLVICTRPGPAGGRNRSTDARSAALSNTSSHPAGNLTSIRRTDATASRVSSRSWAAELGRQLTELRCQDGRVVRWELPRHSDLTQVPVGIFDRHTALARAP